jgi:hypothetical protein
MAIIVQVIIPDPQTLYVSQEREKPGCSPQGEALPETNSRAIRIAKQIVDSQNLPSFSSKHTLRER